ncbi:MAG TPA: flagellar basal-body rod protein FlgF [Terracidiphilus sp.]|jgi:flagellar basal-body rod protein FlgF/flagellar basal-body rod protein FlgG|nr:flagellar basal-body rod protein FlgF [Terracidiphilus sp.]
MDSGYYAAGTALVTSTQQMDTIANNLANVSTVGYRAEHNVFSAVLADASNPSGSSIDQAINNYGIVSGTVLDHSQGALQKTGNDLDAAIQGPGYFVVQTAKGVMYTRNGSFQVSGQGQLVTSTGDAVMGEGGVIKMPPGHVSISADGTISTNGAITGKLRLVDFAPTVDLESAGNTYYTAPANTAQPSTTSDVRQGFLESSNVNPILGLVDLITTQRSAEMMQRALSMFNTEIDKTATQDLPKVG